MNRKNNVVSQLALNGCILGISEWTNGYDFQIYPNPLQSKFFLKVPNNFTHSVLNITIKDLMGKDIKSFQFIIPDERIVLINVDDLESGIYFYSIRDSLSDKNFVSGKLVVIK